MRFGKLLIGALAMFISITAHGEWTQLTTGVSDNFYSVYFFDASYGFITGWGASAGAVTLVTADSGQTWEPYHHPNGTFYFGMDFTDELNGWIAGYRGGASVLHTTNGGSSWTHRALNAFGLYEVKFPAADTGYTCGYEGRIFKTVNGGTDWNATATGTNTLVFTRICFVNALHGWAMAGTDFSQPSLLYRTTDGQTWEEIHDFGNGVIGGLHFFDADTGVVVGHSGAHETAQVSYDGGITWDERHAGPGNRVLQAMRFSGTDGWACGDGARVLQTIDRGETWTTEITGAPAATTFLSICRAGENVCVVGTNGRAYRQTPTPSISGDDLPTVSSFRLLQNYPNPFNPLTEIRFDLPERAYVELAILNSLGQHVAMLIDEPRVAGTYHAQWDGSDVAGGVYLYQLKAGNFVETKKMVLIK